MTRQPLTPKQRETYDLIAASIKEKGYAPTLKEIAAVMGVSHVTVFERVCALERYGWLRRAKQDDGRGRKRNIELVPDEPEYPLSAVRHAVIQACQRMGHGYTEASRYAMDVEAQLAVNAGARA